MSTDTEREEIREEFIRIWRNPAREPDGPKSVRRPPPEEADSDGPSAEEIRRTFLK